MAFNAVFDGLRDKIHWELVGTKYHAADAPQRGGDVDDTGPTAFCD
jgi:hypothetical protein